MLFKRGSSVDEVVSHLGEGAELIGEVSFTNRLQVNGTIKGKINSQGILEIGSSGKVDAEVDVKKVEIRGEFRGVIRASDRVEIQKDGKVFGDIFAPCLIIEAGALFEGRCNMSQGSTERTSQSAAGA